MNIATLNRKSKIELIPIILFSSVVPLIVFNKFTELSDTVSNSSLGMAVSADPFSFYKMILILACAVTAVVIFTIKLTKKEIKFKINFIVAGVIIYALLTLLSAIFSDYPSVAFFGGPERMEGALTILSYIVIFIYIFHIVDTGKKAKIVLLSMMISATVITIIGAFQFFGFDPFKSDFIRKILNMMGNEKFPYEINTVQGANTSYSTLATTNYMAMYLAVVMSSGLALFAEAESGAKRFSAAILVYLMAVCLIGSAAGGAYYAVGISMILLLFLAFPYIKRNVINITMLTVIVIGLLFITNLFMNNLIASRLNIKTVSYELAIGTPENTSIYIDDIILGDTSVSIYTTDKNFSVTNTGSELIVKDLDNNIIPVYIYDEGDNDLPGDIYLFENPEYSDYFLKAVEEYHIFVVKAGAREMFFYMTDEGIKVPGMAYELQKIYPIERNTFIYENVRTFHGRGYIWAASLPLLKDTIFIGNGPDTFFLHFPQNDVIGKINMTGRFNVVIGKPHNHFIQIAHDSGIIALIIMLSVFAYYLIDSFILLFKNKGKYGTRILRTAALCGTLGYLVSCLVYDSNVNVAPVFWTIFALGVTLNHLYRKSLTSQ